MTALKIADNLSLPLDAVTQTFGILAVRGAGKTYTALKLAELLTKAGSRVCVIDPIGVSWGLRSSADGKHAGLPVIILGGEHADVPLDVAAGAVIADFVVDHAGSCVLDLSLLRKGEQTRFLTDFAEKLYHRNREPLHLVLDEADAYAPQKPMPGQQRLLGAIEDLVRRGRARGLGITLVTQRSAVLNKDVLTQVETLIALRTIAPQDRAAIDAWVKIHGDEAERQKVMTSLPSLQRGEAWIWSPAWLGILQRVTIAARETFDSSATPKAGKRPAAPKVLAPVDLAALKARVADSIERVKQDDPRELRKKIADQAKRIGELEKQLARASTVPTASSEPMVRAADVRKLELLIEGVQNRAKELVAGANKAHVDRRQMPLPLHAATPQMSVAKDRRRGARDVFAGVAPERASNGHLKPSERKILTALAQYPGGRSKTQLAMLTVYSSKGGGFNNLLGALRTRGLIEGSDHLQITNQGLTELGSFEPLPTGPRLRTYWAEQLSRAERLIFEALCEAFPKQLTKDELARATGYEASGGGFNNALGRLRTLELVVGRGELQAHEDLFA